MSFSTLQKDCQGICWNTQSIQNLSPSISTEINFYKSTKTVYDLTPTAYTFDLQKVCVINVFGAKPPNQPGHTILTGYH